MLDTRKRESIYQPEQAGLKFPEKPNFATHAEERRHRQERLVAACRAFALHGLDYGFAGHLTVRDPEHPHLYWTNPMAVHFSQVKCSNLILADHSGLVVEGEDGDCAQGSLDASREAACSPLRHTKAQLGRDEPALAGLLEWAQKHHDIVARFGRFPHRNAALGRPTMAEEAEFLKQPGSGF